MATCCTHDNVCALDVERNPTGNQGVLVFQYDEGVQ